MLVIALPADGAVRAAVRRPAVPPVKRESARSAGMTGEKIWVFIS